MGTTRSRPNRPPPPSPSPRRHHAHHQHEHEHEHGHEHEHEHEHEHDGDRANAATAVVEPDTVAGLGLGATKTDVTAVLGTPTKPGQDTDVGGAKYDYLRRELDGNRGLGLTFRMPAATSPRLTDWIATAKGPRTKSGIKVGDPATKVVAALGALQPFCCDSKIASAKQGAGRMIIVVPNGAAVVQPIGGDESFWSGSIAD